MKRCAGGPGLIFLSVTDAAAERDAFLRAGALRFVAMAVSFQLGPARGRMGLPDFDRVMDSVVCYSVAVRCKCPEATR
jgi:hypothetical protein